MIRCVSINELDHELMRYWILGDKLNTNCNKNRYNDLSVIGKYTNQSLWLGLTTFVNNQRRKGI